MVDNLLSHKFCQSHGIIVFNGRTGKDSTTKNSIVDYVIGSIDLWNMIDVFEILPFDSMCSDIHHPLTMSCNNNVDISQSTEVTNVAEQPQVDIACKRLNIRWDSKKGESLLVILMSMM